MTTAERPPNFLFILADDHAAHALSAYGSRINQTPQLDRLADGGLLFQNAFCTNAICTPSRASILTGTYNHINGVTTLATPLDNRLPTFVHSLRGLGYQTAIFGKWHLGEGARHCPTGFDDWAVLPGQGLYHNPTFLFRDRGGGAGQRRVVPGYATNLITDFSLEWLRARDPERPFFLMCHHKAPHRPWEPDEAHAHLFRQQEIPEPPTLLDDYADRAAAAAAATMRVGRDMLPADLKCEIQRELSEEQLRRWAYQRYIKDYLRVIASIDDQVGRLLDYLDAAGLAENTVVIYTSDQGFFLGDHGWYDKRFMYEESLRMPLLWRHPAGAEGGRVLTEMVLNVDFAPTFLELAGAPPLAAQGHSLAPLLRGETPANWRQAMYYRYWMHKAHHNVYAHYGLRTQRHKLIYHYADGLGQAGSLDERHEPEWELFDLQQDPLELRNVYRDPAYAPTARALTAQLAKLQAELGDSPYDHPSAKGLFG